jgi:hypothetical protein
MNKHILLCSFALFFCLKSIAQPTQPSAVSLLDTLLIATLPLDVEYNFAPVPSGNDTVWVNFDVDGIGELCYDELAYGWVISPDYGNDTIENFAFTSCSWLDESAIFPCPLKNRNWLIMPPITLNGTDALLEWKSSSVYGPAFVDGYKVMVSTTDNFIDSFTDTLFSAAQMIKPINLLDMFSLDPSKYLYSPGYIHANTYMNNTYYFLDTVPENNSEVLKGRLEPHSVNLSEYLGQTIYIAFVHDSDCDYLLQIDDILVTDDGLSSAQDPAFSGKFTLSPNPASGPVQIAYQMQAPAEVALTLFDVQGRPVWEKQLPALQQWKGTAELESLPKGFYTLHLQSSQGTATRKLVLK